MRSSGKARDRGHRDLPERIDVQAALADPGKPTGGICFRLLAGDDRDGHTHFGQEVIDFPDQLPSLPLAGEHVGPERLAEIMTGPANGRLPPAPLVLGLLLAFLAPPVVLNSLDPKLAQDSGQPDFEGEPRGVPELRWPAAPAITVVNRDPQLALGHEPSSPSTWSGPPLPDPDV